MFKRVAKRRRKEEEEEELGLDGEAKEMLGLNDTDSDESSSSSEESEDEAEDAEDDADIVTGNGGEDISEGDDSDAEDEEEEDEQPMSVSEALQNPVYPVSLDPPVNACVVCPGKLLKNITMIAIHKDSAAHKRRFNKLRELAMSANANADVHHIMRARVAKEIGNAPQGVSKRAEKKKAKLAAIRAKREGQKAAKAKKMARKAAADAKEAAENDDSDVSEDDGKTTAPRVKPPPSKKGKVVSDTSKDHSTAAKAPSAPSISKTRKERPRKTSPSKPPASTVRNTKSKEVTRTKDVKRQRTS